METIKVCGLDELDDPGCREFRIGEGDWPFRGFIVRQGERVFAYENYCRHAGHPLNWQPDSFLTADGERIICASHGAEYEIETGRGLSALCRGKSLRPVTAEIRDGIVYVTTPG
jgi:nitrite reductase/ring-hydroxylating ferredoxin subunit